MKNIVFKISGMKCMGYINAVQNILKNYKGIVDAQVDLEKAKAYIKAEDYVDTKSIEK